MSWVRHGSRVVALALALALVPIAAGAATSPLGGVVPLSDAQPYWKVAPAVAGAQGGGFLVVWENLRNGIEGRFLAADGAPRGGVLSLAANTPFPEKAGLYEMTVRREPAIAALPNGGFFLVWTEESTTTRYSYFRLDREVHDSDVWGLRLDAAGAPVGQAVRINADAAAFQSQPAIASDGGLVVVAWQERASLGSATADVEVRCFGASRCGASRDQRVNEALAYAPAAPRLAAGAGGFFVVWVGFDDSSTGILGRALDRRALPAGSEVVVNVRQAGHQLAPTVAGGADGRYLVGWQQIVAPPNPARIDGRLVSSTGEPRGGQLRLAAPLAEEDGAPALARLAGGGYVLTWLGWKSNRPLWIAALELDGAGSAVGTPQRVSDKTPGPQWAMALAPGTDGSLTAAWIAWSDAGYGISARVLRSDAAAVGLSASRAGR